MRETWHETLEAAIGQHGFPLEIVEIAPWRPEQRVAERFQQGRVFLVGDAAHTMPPKEGLGVNTAIQSAQNLAWKLAAVLRGRAAPALLATYEAERRPVAVFAAQHSLTGPAAALLEKAPAREKPSEFFPIAGYRYQSEAVISEIDQPPALGQGIALLDREELTGAPGSRLPHVWLDREEQRISTLDLLDGRFVMMAGPDGAAWCDAADKLAPALGMGPACFRVGPDAKLRDREGDVLSKLGISADGGLLVRPDGFVAWRAARRQMLTSSPETTLEQVLARILSRPMPAGTTSI